MEVISRLCGGSSSLERTAIYGSGGMGKITLAENAYNHPLIVEHFDVRAWAIVTGDYILMRVIGDLLHSMKAEYSISNTEDELVERLLQILGSRRYLIVLDDVWCFKVLERLEVILPDCGNGSRIILITRLTDLAKSAHHIHEMHLFDGDKTWDIIREKIFKGDPCPFQLEAIGKAIASVNVVTGILAYDQSKAAWEDVLNNIRIASEDGEILSLSYIYLPRHLRPCFLYLGLFSETYQIYVSELTRLWAAEGFVDGTGYQSLEETGEEYVEDLVRRSLVSIYRRKSNGRI